MKGTLSLLAVLLAATQGALASSSVGSGPASGSASASLDLRIEIPPVLRLSALGQPAYVQVTAADVAAGEVVVDGARLDAVANDPRGFQIVAEVHGPFTAATIEGLPAPVRAGASQTTRVPMPSMVGRTRPAPFAVRYRLQLREGTAPGRYDWPVALTIQNP